MHNLQDLRNQIDELDTELLHMLQKRIALMKEVGETKKNLQQPIRDEQRERQQLANLEQQARALQIPEILVINIWKLFFELSEEIEK